MIPTECTGADKIISVRIAHDDIHRIDYSYLAELFRYLGVFVCEEILVEQHEEDFDKKTEYSATIAVRKETAAIWKKALSGAGGSGFREKEIQELEDLCERNLQKLSEEKIFLYSEDVMGELEEQEGENISPAGMLFQASAEQQKVIVQKLLERFFDCIYDNSTELESRRVNIDQISELLHIFVEEKLWFHSLNLQYYKKRDTMASRAAKEKFLQAHGRIKKACWILGTDESGREESRMQYLYEYAQLWCEVKVNTACDYCNDLCYFPIENVSERCRNLCEKYPWFVNAKVLLGLCYEPFADRVNEAVMAFDEALQHIKTRCFASSIYYWIGKRYEPYKDRREEAKHAYELANQSRAKFRNVFKLAVFARNEKDYKKAEEYFYKILNGLKRKVALYFVDPLEIEYLFKTYTQLCFIYHEKEEYVQAIEAGEKVLSIVDKYIHPENPEELNDYFNAFYGKENSAVYREIMGKRLNAATAYKLLDDCYTKILEPDRAKEYRKKAAMLSEKE